MESHKNVPPSSWPIWCKVLAFISMAVVGLVYQSYGVWPLLLLVLFVRRNTISSSMGSWFFKFWLKFWSVVFKEITGPILPLYQGMEDFNDNE